MAGGAWASSFLRQLGVTFPQASIRSTVLALAPGVQDLPPAFHTKGVTVTRRGDGGHTIAIGGCGRLDVTPQSLLAADGVPSSCRRSGVLKKSNATLDRLTPKRRNTVVTFAGRARFAPSNPASGAKKKAT